MTEEPLPNNPASRNSGSDSAPQTRFLHPFHEDPADGDAPPGTWAPRTLAELRMYRLSAQIRQKHRWWEKARDVTIRSKWIQEVKEQQAQLQPWEKLTDNMVSRKPMQTGFTDLSWS